MRTTVEAFNEWMRLYTDNPEQFEREWQTVNRYLSEKNNGVQPSYGEAATEYLKSLMNEEVVVAA